MVAASAKADMKNIDTARAGLPQKGGKEAQIIREVVRLTEPFCLAEGYELVLVEFQAEARGKILRLYLDKAGGFGLEDCVYVSRQLSDLFDVALEDVGPYQLEVSSPGIDRPLGKESDFNRFKGEKAKIKTRRPVAGRKNFTGVLLGIKDGVVHMSIDEDSVAIPYNQIQKARLVGYGE